MAGLNKFWWRLFIIFLIHIIFKSFDLSFPNGPLALDFRSLSFTLYFIGYGLFVWYLADIFNSIIIKWLGNAKNHTRKLTLITLLHSVFGFILMVIFNYLYKSGDLLFFGKKNLWEGNNFFNPELTVALLSAYLVILGFDGYIVTQKELQAGLLRTEQLKKENILAQYKALKAQIEPHFLFNNLSVLSSLVYKDAGLSADFIIKLSKSLRYIIEKNEFYLVPLSEEIKFLDSYFFLIKTRLDDGIFLENQLDSSVAGLYYIPPATIQMLIENAINHNKYSPEEPLRVTIEKVGSDIVVRNNLNLRPVHENSTKQGLKNISQRYELIGAKKVRIEKTSLEFIVKIPLLNQEDYERFNI